LRVRRREPKIALSSPLGRLPFRSLKPSRGIVLPATASSRRTVSDNAQLCQLQPGSKMKLDIRPRVGYEPFKLAGCKKDQA